MKVYKIRNNDTGLYKKSSSSRSYASSAYWSKVGMLYSTKGHAVGALNSARKRFPDADIQIVEFDLVECR